ncbi:hypothetical protein ACFVVC_01670 [Pseudarthrobacter sp. NPDC058196]|uniref:hypothetical protein n=1 Tax=Pseudarthrobacter sp. NPDC058196 TaxID=3346376 RepID=UPI0036DE2255
MSAPANYAAASSSGRFREWTLVLAPTHEDRDLAKGRKFTADSAILRISAVTEDAPFTQVHVILTGNGRKKRLSREYRNDHRHPDLSIHTAPGWVRDLVVEVTGTEELAANETTDVRVPAVAELQEAA